MSTAGLLTPFTPPPSSDIVALVTDIARATHHPQSINIPLYESSSSARAHNVRNSGGSKPTLAPSPRQEVMLSNHVYYNTLTSGDADRVVARFASLHVSVLSSWNLIPLFLKPNQFNEP